MLPRPRFWIVQYMMASRSVRPLIPPKIGRTRLLPPAKPPALKPTMVVGEKGQDLRPVQIHQGGLDGRPLGGQLGPIQEAHGDQLGHRDRIGHDRMRHHEGVGGMEANRGIEIQEPAEHGRGRREPRPQRPGCTASRRANWVAARLASASRPCPALGIIDRQFGNHACLVASLDLGRAAGLRSQKLAVRPRDLEKHLVTNRDRGELALADGLFARQVGKDPLPDILRQIDARDC